MDNTQLYEINPSQEVVKLQCKFTLFKRVINILSSATTSKNIDKNLMTKAINLTIERNDCLRIKFVKQNGKLMQYFKDKVEVNNIPYIELNTKEEQENFFLKIRKKAVKYLKGQTFEIYYLKTYNNKFMLVFKVCHLIFDIYGLNNVYKDLFDIYTALENKTELPPPTTKFEDVVKKDLVNKNNTELHKRNKEFFENYLNSHEYPYYAGLHGKNLPLWQKLLKKNKRTMKMFFVKNDTKSYMFKIKKTLTEKAIEYCKQNHYTLSNFFFYAMSVTTSKMNGDIKNMLPLELCNCRATITEKKCGGTKVQSIGCYTTVEREKSFDENLKTFSNEQTNLYRYIGFSDQEFQMLLHKAYKSSLLSTFYSITFSFIPYEKINDFDIQIYSNGKCALPAYTALMWDINSNEISTIYDVQTKIISKEAIENFHKNYVETISQILSNPQILIKDIKF